MGDNPTTINTAAGALDIESNPLAERGVGMVALSFVVPIFGRKGVMISPDDADRAADALKLHADRARAAAGITG